MTMRLPIEPLSSLEKLPTSETEVRQTEPVLSARAIGAQARGQPEPHSPSRGPDADARDPVAAVLPLYSGAERRQAERRLASQDTLLDTRARRDRRKDAAPAVDLKV